MANTTPCYVVLDDDRPVSGQLVDAVASMVDDDRSQLPPLQAVVDPESLDALAREDATRSVSVHYAGFHLSVRNGRRLIVRDPDSIHARLAGASNVLVTTPDRGADPSALLTPYPPAWANVLSVTYDEPAVRVAERPAETAIVAVGEFTRSAGSDRESAPTADVPSVTPVRDPTDLSALSAAITDQLAAWADDENATVVRFHSASATLRHVDSTAARRFFETLAREIGAADAIAHYHVDPEACSASDLEALESIVDATVERGAEGLRVRDV